MDTIINVEERVKGSRFGWLAGWLAPSSRHSLSFFFKLMTFNVTTYSDGVKFKPAKYKKLIFHYIKKCLTSD